jgi:hypothetical protein
MIPTDSQSPDSDPAPAEIPPPPIPKAEKSLSAGYGRCAVLAIGAGLLAGVASFVAGEMIMNHYRSNLLAPLSISPSAEDVHRWKAARIHSATITFATMGGLLGVAMGLAGGLARRSIFGGVKAAILGLLLGAAGAASLALALASIFYERRDP